MHTPSHVVPPKASSTKDNTTKFTKNHAMLFLSHPTLKTIFFYKNMCPCSVSEPKQPKSYTPTY